MATGKNRAQQKENKFRSTVTTIKYKVKAVKRKWLKIGLIASAICFTIIVIGIFLLIGWPHTPKGDFEGLFSSLTIGIPEYENLGKFSQPEDGALTSDICLAEFDQSETQFRHFATKLGVSEKELLASNGITHFRVNSIINTNCPWFLNVRATNAEPKLFRIHLEGVQFYN